MSPHRLGLAAATLALSGVALVVRHSQQHAALLYPDGYQYLLMARGIGEHLEPTTTLGPGGDEFVPVPDAAVKPLFPLLVAGAHYLGPSLLDAAALVTVISGALAVVLLALLVTKLGGSASAGVLAGVLLLASPSAGFWSGFSGPDPLAQVLVLASSLAFVYRWPTAGGVLTGLAVATRPELALLAAAAAIISLRRSDTRGDLVRAAPACLATASLVFLLLRTPIAIQDGHLVWMTLVALGLIAGIVFLPPALLRYLAVAAGAAVAVSLLTQPGPAQLLETEWPLLSLAAVGFVLLLRDERRSPLAVATVGAVLLLGAVYVYKNPNLVRYFSLLLPAVALVVGVAVASLPLRLRPALLVAMACAAVLGFLGPVPGSRDYDMFAVVAERVALRPASEPLVTAAPDAYGFWLPDRSVQGMKQGARGTILLDAAQRLYEPELGAEGRVVARVNGEIAFSRPNGDIDAAPAVLVTGRVVVLPEGGGGARVSP